MKISDKGLVLVGGAGHECNPVMGSVSAIYEYTKCEKVDKHFPNIISATPIFDLVRVHIIFKGVLV